MKFKGLTAEQVDARVDAFAALMQVGMREVCVNAASHMLALTADGATDGELSAAVDSLGVMSAQWNTYTADVLMPALADVTLEAGKVIAVPLGSVHVPDIKTGQFIEQMQGWVTGLSGDMWKTAKTTLVTGAQDGATMAELAASIEQVAHVKAKKAHTIAQTAVIAAINGGEWQQMMEFTHAFDVEGVKEWEATEDSHTRPDHHEADGQRVAIDSHFVVGGEFMLFPGDPEASPAQVANCRCTTLYDLPVEDQIMASQTSPEHGSATPTVDTNGQYWPMEDAAVTAAVNAAFNAMHPRGKDGKFIKKGEGLPAVVLKGLTMARSQLEWGDMGNQQKKDFIHEVTTISPTQWDNLVDEDQTHIAKLVSDALDEGQPGSAKASLHLEALNSGDLGSDDEGDVFNPAVSVPSVAPAKKTTPKKIASATPSTKKNVSAETTKALENGDITEEQHDSVFDAMDKYGPGMADQILKGYKNLNEQNTSTNVTPSTSPPVTDVPTLTTGSSEPIKITHGLIHAKYLPGDILAQSKDGKTRIIWDGFEYKVQSRTDQVVLGNTVEAWNTKATLKKSKLYAYIASNHNNETWVKSGKQETEVSHATPLDAAPPLKSIPHPMGTLASIHPDLVDSFDKHASKGAKLYVDTTNGKAVYQTSDGAWLKEWESPTGVKIFQQVSPGALNTKLKQGKLSLVKEHDATTTTNTPFDDVSSGDVKADVTVAFFKKKITEAQFNEIVTGINDGTLTEDQAKEKFAQALSKPPIAWTSIPGLSNSSVNDALDNAFGPENTGLAPTPASSNITVTTLTEVPESLPELNDYGNKWYAQALKKWQDGTVTKDEFESLVDVIKSVDKYQNSTPSSSEPINVPNVAPNAGPIPTTASSLPVATKWEFYNNFKAEKVSPAWSGAKIYASMHAAKAKMSGHPGIDGLSDDEVLKLLDSIEIAKNGAKNGVIEPYSVKVKEWLKTPNGQKAFKQLNPSIPTTSPSVAKKVAGAAKKTTADNGVSVDEALGDTSVNTLVNAPTLYQSFKNSGYGKYLDDKPEHIYWNAVQQSKAIPNTTPGQILAIVDAEGAKKFGVPNEKKFTQKVTDWLNTPTGKKKAAEIKAGTYSPSASTYSYGGSSNASYTHPANTPLNDKIPPIQAVEEFDPTKGYDWKKSGSKDFPVINDAKAKKMTDEWSAAQGKMTATQKAALRKYSGSSYTPMNNYLRGYSGATDQIHNDVQDAQSGMRLSLEPIVLHRGNGWFNGWNSVAEVKSHLGEDFHQEAFFSASIGGKSAFGGPINFVIECPPGTPMAYVDTFSLNKGENEMLLGGNLTYKVVEVISGETTPDGSEHYNTVVTVRLRVIPPSPNQISYGSVTS